MFFHWLELIQMVRGSIVHPRMSENVSRQCCGHPVKAGVVGLKLEYLRAEWGEEVRPRQKARVCAPRCSSPYDFSKTIIENVKENGERTQGAGKNPF